MPILVFNKGVKKSDGLRIPDRLIYVIKPDYFKRIFVQQIQFEAGFSHHQEIVITTNVDEEINLSQYKQPHNFSLTMLTINKAIAFAESKNLELEFLTKRTESIKFSLYYKYI